MPRSSPHPRSTCCASASPRRRTPRSQACSSTPSTRTSRPSRAAATGTWSATSTPRPSGCRPPTSTALQTPSSRPAGSQPDGSSPPRSPGRSPRSTRRSTAGSACPTGARCSAGTPRTSSIASWERCRRAGGDGSAICTLVTYGCHPVTTGYDMTIYSADYPGPLRALVREVSGGAVHVLPGVGRQRRAQDRVHGRRARGRAHGTAPRARGAARARGPLVGATRGGHPARGIDGADHRLPGARAVRARPVLAVAEQRVRIAFSEVPPLDQVVAQRAGYDAALAAARAAGDVGAVRVAMVGAHWAEITEHAIRTGTLEPHADLPVNAVRIGDGVVITAPGETFTEIGMAVKERAPGAPTHLLRLHERHDRLHPDRGRVPLRRARAGARQPGGRHAGRRRSGHGRGAGPCVRCDSRSSSSPAACRGRRSAAGARPASSRPFRPTSCSHPGGSGTPGRAGDRRMESRRSR